MDIDDKNGDDKNERSAELVAANQNEGMLYPISYTVDHYFTFYENDKHR